MYAFLFFCSFLISRVFESLQYHSVCLLRLCTFAPQTYLIHTSINAILSLQNTEQTSPCIAIDLKTDVLTQPWVIYPPGSPLLKATHLVPTAPLTPTHAILPPKTPTPIPIRERIAGLIAAMSRTRETKKTVTMSAATLFDLVPRPPLYPGHGVATSAITYSHSARRPGVCTAATLSARGTRSRRT